MEPTGSFYMNGSSLINLAFDGKDVNEDAKILEMSDPELFNQGIVEHARYLGMDPEIDAKYLWIAKESLVAPVPEGWSQESTYSGAPYYYNHFTGESRWEHPKDAEYSELFRKEKEKDQWQHEKEIVPEGGDSWRNEEHYPTTTAWNEEDTEPYDSYNWNDSDRTEQAHEFTEHDLEPYVAHKEPKVATIELDASEESRQVEPTETLRDQITAIEDEKRRLEQLLESTNTTLCDSQARVERLERQLKHNSSDEGDNAELLEELNQLRQTVDTQAQSHSEEVSELTAKCQQLSTQIDTLTQEKTDLEYWVEKGQTDLQECSQLNASSTEEATEQLNADNQLLRQELEVLRDTLEESTAQAQQLQTKVEMLETVVETTNGSNTVLSKELEDATLRVKTLTCQIEQTGATADSDKFEYKKREMELKHQVASLEAQYSAFEIETQNAAKELQELADAQTERLNKTLEREEALQDELEKKTEEIKTLGAQHENVVAELATQTQQVRSLQERLEEIEQSIGTAVEKAREETRAESQQKIQETQEACDRYKEMYNHEMKKRRQLHNRVMELQGNIRVFCRVRPIQEVELKTDQSAQAAFFSDTDNQSLNLIVGEGPDFGGQRHNFEFDHVFQPKSSQGEVFNETCALITSALDGYNVCVFAYGQTGSGKTFTMEGPENNRGVNFRAMQELFKVRDERHGTGQRKYHLKLSMLEVYNETIVDLLAETNTDKKQTLDIRVSKQGAYVENLISVEVFNEDDVKELMELGHSHRSVGAHDANEHSSRSHLVLCINIESINTSDGSRITSKLNLIDLAGSERLSKTAASGQRLKEAQNINRSLSALGDVIAALGNNSKHVPYRNSKLDCLSGNSKVLMFVNISPVQWNAVESLCSLNFASRCRSVSLGQAKVNNLPRGSSGSPGRASLASIARRAASGEKNPE